MQLLHTLTRATTRSAEGREGVERRFEHPRVEDVCRRLLDRQRDAPMVDHKLALQAPFAAVRRAGTGLFAPPGAATLAESSEALDQSIQTAFPRRLSNAR
jgi:hypothetical protein